jgi:hypothetical protein
MRPKTHPNKKQTPISPVARGRLGKAKYFASTVLGGLEEETEADHGVTP